MKMEIKSRWSKSVLFTLETDSLKLAVEAGVKIGADLRAADLRGADLRGADLIGALLTGAILRGADLTRALLRGADLRGADLIGADLIGADLRGADLRGAGLTGADLTGAILTGADLTGAILIGADLRGADLRGASLLPIRDDLWAVLSSAPSEVVGLRTALIQGRIDGSTYKGPCACLVGTLANVRQCDFKAIPGLVPNSSRPAERFFLMVRPGDTPETSVSAKIALEWIDTWLVNMRAAFGVKV